MSDPGQNLLPGWHRDDPDTSKLGAFDAYPRSGTHRLLALDVVWGHRFDGVTYEDVERITGVRGIWKRLSELKQGGWIIPKGTRKVSTKSQADIYYPTMKTFQRYWER
jgi:hypothetical protein